MDEMKKVLKGLECCTESISKACPMECPYRVECMMQDDGLQMYSVMHAALKLLKEQSEADEVAPTIGEGAEGEEVIRCGACGTALYHLFPWVKINKAREFVRYCRHCGQKVKWDDI